MGAPASTRGGANAQNPVSPGAARAAPRARLQMTTPLATRLKVRPSSHASIPVADPESHPRPRERKSRRGHRRSQWRRDSASAIAATQELVEPLLAPLAFPGLQALDRTPDGRKLLLDLDDDLLRRRWWPRIEQTAEVPDDEGPNGRLRMLELARELGDRLVRPGSEIRRVGILQVVSYDRFGVAPGAGQHRSGRTADPTQDQEQRADPGLVVLGGEPGVGGTKGCEEGLEPRDDRAASLSRTTRPLQ